MEWLEAQTLTNAWPTCVDGQNYPVGYLLFGNPMRVGWGGCREVMKLRSGRWCQGNCYGRASLQ
jgi:hypothetical protein